jgi:energy-coupling factor transport system ATP-binding protein
VTANFVAYVPQDVRAGFVGVTVAEEVGMTLTLRGEHRYQVDARVIVMARDMGIAHLLDRPVTDLSAGEATLVALGAALIGLPSVLLIDEPFADLDDDALARVSDTLRDLATRTGITLVIAEHRIAPLTSLASTRLHISHGTVRTVDLDSDFYASASHSRSAVSGSSREMWPIHENSSRPVALVGPNGSGTTTRLWRLALPGGKRATGIRLVPENPRDLFTRESVAEECRAQDRQHRKRPSVSSVAPTTSSRDVVHGILGDTIDVNVHPRDLSTGQQRALAIALQLHERPRTLLIDEPTRGLDRRACVELAQVLARVSQQGIRVIVATHDQSFATLIDARVLTLAPRLEAVMSS